MINNKVIVSKNCVYLRDYDSNNEIWIDYGEFGECRDLFFYENNKYTIAAYFAICHISGSSGFIQLTNKYNLYEKPYCWNYEKIDDFSIKINNKIYTINKDDSSQMELFDNMIKKWF